MENNFDLDDALNAFFSSDSEEVSVPLNCEEAYKKIIYWLDNNLDNFENNARELLAKNVESSIGGCRRVLSESWAPYLSKYLITLAWKMLYQDETRLTFNREPIKCYANSKDVSFINQVLKYPNLIKRFWENHRDAIECFYFINPDVAVYVDGKLIMYVECKAYAENSMLFRVLPEGYLIFKEHPDVDIILFQVESGLGGEYCYIKPIEETMPSDATIVRMTQFPYYLHIFTCLKGERKNSRPIYKPGCKKSLEISSLNIILDRFKKLLEKRI